ALQGAATWRASVKDATGVDPLKGVLIGGGVLALVAGAFLKKVGAAVVGAILGAGGAAALPTRGAKVTKGRDAASIDAFKLATTAPLPDSSSFADKLNPKAQRLLQQANGLLKGLQRCSRYETLRVQTHDAAISAVCQTLVSCLGE